MISDYLISARKLTTFVLFCLFCSSGKASELSARDWLDRMALALKQLNYDLSFVYIRDGQVESMRMLHAIHSGHEKQRLIHLDGSPREIIRTNQLVTYYFSGAAPIILDSSLQNPLSPAFVQSISDLNTHYKVNLLGQDRVAGRVAKHIQVKSIDGDRYDYHFWIDNETHLLLRSDTLDNNKQLVEQLVVVNASIKEHIPETDFEVGISFDSVRSRALNSSTSERVSNVTLPAPAWKVTWIPAGFELKKRQQQIRKGQRNQPIFSFLFSDGIASISVFIREMKISRQIAPRMMKRGGATVYDMVRNKHNITVVGEIPATTAEKIAKSVKKLAVQE